MAFIIASLALLLHEAVSLYGVLLAGSVTLCYWLGFALNDYFDRDFDARDPEKRQRNFFISNQISKQQLFTVILLILLPVFLIFNAAGNTGRLFFVVGVGAMVAYSAPPLRLKTVPVADLAMHVLFVETFPYVSMLALLKLPFTALDATLLLCLGMASLTTQLEQQVRDYETDKLHEQNFTVRFGRNFSKGLMRILSISIIALLSVQAFRGVIPALLFPFAFIGLPLFWFRLRGDAQQARASQPVLLMTVGAVLYTAFLYVAIGF